MTDECLKIVMWDIETHFYNGGLCSESTVRYYTVQNCTLEKAKHVQNVHVTTAVVNHTAIKISTNVDYTGVEEKKREDSSDRQIVSVQFDVENSNVLKGTQEKYNLLYDSDSGMSFFILMSA